MKLIDRIREVMALKHYARRTRECYEIQTLKIFEFSKILFESFAKTPIHRPDQRS